MRIACPRCSALYEEPDVRLKPGKLVRCVRCEGDWTPILETDAAIPPADDEERSPSHPEDHEEAEAEPVASAPMPEVSAMDRLAASPAVVPSRTGLIGAWVVTLVLIVGAVAAVIGWRDTVVRAWPPSGRILPAIGHTTPPPVPTARKTAE